MKAKTLLLLLLLLAEGNSVFAQKENNVWIFGQNIGLDFNSGTTSLISSAINTREGCASVCDARGNLLFYSNGLQVWDNTHTVMPNGNGILGDPYMSTTMGVAITPLASDTNLYFLFTLDAYGTSTATQLKYSLIDMRLNSGKGDIVPGIKNIIVPGYNRFSEKMLVAPSCNGLWLILHHRDSALFYAYRITNTTIPPPVLSTTAGINAADHYSLGEIKLSSDYRHIAMGNYNVSSTLVKSRIEILNFDKITGTVSTGFTIDSFLSAYSIEFSPDGSKLYTGNYMDSVYQYDLSLLPSLPAVYASKYAIKGKLYMSLRRAPDNKIYAVRSISGRISRINNPDLAGAACNVELDVPSLTSSSGLYLIMGNNTFKPNGGGLIGETTFTSRKDSTICSGNTLTYTASAGRDIYLWNDGDTSRKRVFSTSGTYWITSYNLADCRTYIDTFNLVIKPITDITSSFDTLACFKDSLVVTAATYTSYRWSDGRSTRDNLFTGSGTKWVKAPGDGCTQYIDTFQVTLTNFSLDIRDTSICLDQPIIFDADIHQPARYLWQDGSTGKTFTARSPGKYHIEVSVGKCKKENNIIVDSRMELSAGNDTTVCNGIAVTLTASDMDSADYLWSNGSVGKTIQVKEPGNYTVTVSKNNCKARDSVLVTVDDCEDCIHIPNAFTPDNDGINDRFKIINSCPLQQFSMIIFNRFGQVIFQSNDYLQAWDGKTKGQEQDIGVYFYLVRTKLNTPDAQEKLYKGEVTLLR